MKILVITSDVPFVDGGHRVFARSVRLALETAGHEAEIMTTPTNRFGRQLSAYLANRLTDVVYTGDGGSVDSIVSLRYPAHVVPHPHHRLWLTHLLREYYDLWDDYRNQVGALRVVKDRVRRAIVRRWDLRALARLERRFVISKTVKARLDRYLGVPSDVLYPPPQERPYRTDAYEDFVLAPSRLHPLKRQELLVRALARRPALRGVIVGTGSDRARLEALARDLGVGERLAFEGFVSEERLCELYARCRAVFFAPRDEDYGFITLEAFRSGKAVLTCADSGGPTELVRSGESGCVVAPTEDAVAKALDEIASDEQRSRRMGEAGRMSVKDITWERAIRTLLA